MSLFDNVLCLYIILKIHLMICRLCLALSWGWGEQGGGGEDADVTQARFSAFDVSGQDEHTGWGQVGDRGVCPVLGVPGGGSLGSCQRTGCPGCSERRGRQEERLTSHREGQGPSREACLGSEK